MVAPVRTVAKPALAAKAAPPAAPAKTPGGFKRPAPAAPAQAPRKPKSKYGGIQRRAPRDPMLEVGTYRLKVLSCTEGYNEGEERYSFKATWEVISVLEANEHSNAVGDVASVVFMQNTKPGRSDIKGFCMGFAGFLNDAEYDAYDPDGFFIEACTGVANEYSAALGDVQPIVGRICDVRVRRGNSRADGDWYRNYDFYAIDESEQEVPIPEISA